MLPWSDREETMRIALGVLAGAVVAFICIFAIEVVGHMIFPPPADFDINDRAQMERLMETVPPGALALVLVAWFTGALLGAWTADKVARRGLAGWIVALLVICGGVWTMLLIPHPAWIWALGIALPLAAAWLAQRLARMPL
jgi:hypothetical protein